MKFDFYSDPGHGWLKVKRSLLEKLGLENSVSYCSYERNGNVYLEEDGDATRFIKKLQEVGIKFEYRYHNSNKRSKIRNYNHFILK